MNTSALRVMNDYVDLTKNKLDGIYLWIDKENIFQQYALIMGPENTPYFGGYFFFDIKYPLNYPQSPPIVNFLTINNKVRFNPNLYESGKVCLSILGTWAGPGWKPIMNIRLILNSIRSLMGEFPIQNEPGFENTKPDHISSIEYNLSLIYHTYNLAILDVLDKKFIFVSKYFETEIISEYNKNKKKLQDDLLSYQQIYGNIPVDKQIYFMKKEMLNFNELVTKFNKILIK